MVNVPIITWREWTPTIDPSGFRISDNAGDLATAGYIKDLGITAGKTAIFDNIDITNSGQISSTKLLTAHVDDWGDASGIWNLKFYLSSNSAFTAGTYRFLYDINQHLFNGKTQLDENDNDLPTSEPTNPNIVSTLGSGVLVDTGFNDETQCSEYVWIALYIGQDVTVDTYGGPGSNTFRYRLKYDFS